ncbi:hypothetical protein [Bacillus solitudinis]|uniref:hypothetical protein n=1 Tax=Bacillus solitudinis TaxID=2014074 RepID=UPI000C2344C5|nr:hypothetical protein [Bacillus solitudinis]
MQIIKGHQPGDLVIEKDTMVIGEVQGNIQVLSGAKLTLDATVLGDIHLKKNAMVLIQNKLEGNIYNSGGVIDLLNGEVTGEIIKKL